MAGKVSKQIFHLFKRAAQFADFTVVKSLGLRAAKLSIVNFLGLALLFVTNYLIVRYAGEHAYGNFSVINVWVNFFVVFVLFGFDDLFITMLPRLENSRRGMIALLRRGFIISFIILMVIGLTVLLLLRKDFLPPVIATYKWLFLIQIGVLAIFLLLSSYLRGLNKILIGQLFEKVLRPLLILLLLLFVYQLQNRIGLEQVLIFQIAALFLPCCLFVWILFRKWGRTPLQESNPATSLKSNFTFLCISLLYLLSTRLDLLMLSASMPPQQVGYYNIAARIAEIVGYPLMAINLIVHTLLAKEYQERSKSSLYKYILRISGFTFLTTASIFLLILFLGRSVLGIFGERFVSSFVPLLILSASHLLYSLSLPFNALLMVSSKERLSLLTLVANVATTFLFAYYFIPAYASKGAALAVLSGSGAYLLATFFVVNHLRDNGR